MSVAVQTLAFTLAGNAPSAPGTAEIAKTALILGGYQSLTVVGSLAANTGGTLNAYLQFTPNGSDWFDWLAFPQLAAGGPSIVRLCAAVRPTAQATLQTIGSGLTPALAAGTFLATDWGVGLRLVAVSGNQTSAGGALSVAILASQVAGAS